MLNVPEHIDELIALSLAGEANSAQLQELDHWRTQDETHERYYQQCSVIFSQSASGDQQQYNSEAAWQRVQPQLSKRIIRELHPSPASVQWKPLLRIAAVILFIAGLGWWINSNVPRAAEQTISAYNRIVHDTLPDGSSITLNKNTSLTLTADFGKKERRLRLRGEAFFTVTHEEERPFIIEANGIFIQDIGTAFNVEAPDDSSYVKVYVEEGTVHFFKEGTEGVILERGQAAIYHSSTGLITRLKELQPAETAYRNGILPFNNARLSEVAVALSKLYEIPVIIDPGLQDCLITVTFKNEPIDTVLAVIAETLDLKIEKADNTIFLRGDNCGN